MNAYVFVFFFASAFLLGGKRPVLARSTRALLVVLLGLAAWYATSPEGSGLKGTVGIATLVANVAFIVFAAIDYFAYQKKKLAGE